MRIADDAGVAKWVKLLLNLFFFPLVLENYMETLLECWRM